jgi:hypothetical protein
MCSSRRARELGPGSAAPKGQFMRDIMLRLWRVLLLVALAVPVALVGVGGQGSPPAAARAAGAAAQSAQVRPAARPAQLRVADKHKDDDDDEDAGHCAALGAGWREAGKLRDSTGQKMRLCRDARGVLVVLARSERVCRQEPARVVKVFVPLVATPTPQPGRVIVVEPPRPPVVVVPATPTRTPTPLPWGASPW